MPPLAREASQPTNLALPYACSSPIRKLLTASHKYAPALPTFGASQLTMVGHNKKKYYGTAAPLRLVPKRTRWAHGPVPSLAGFDALGW